MSKSKRRRTSDSSESLETALGQASALIQKEHFSEALNMLEPLLPRYRSSPGLHALLGHAYLQAGELWNAATHYEMALALRKDARLLISLGYVYLGLDLRALAVDVLRRGYRSGIEDPQMAELPEILQSLKEELQISAELLGISLDRATKGLRFLEQGQLALHTGSYGRSIQLNRRALRFLDDHPPPRNNLSLALFFHGQPEEAIRTAQKVIERHPDNVQALGNLVRFLAWTGRPDEARHYWERLRTIDPPDATSRMKIVEAAAIMEADEVVYRLLKEKPRLEEVDEGFARQQEFYLAIAEANTGRRSARKRLRKLKKSMPWAGIILEALQAGQRGLGWTDRFPYHHGTELIPREEMEAFLELVSRADQMPEAKYRSQVGRFAARFPQLVLMGKKTLWEDQMPEAAIGLLSSLATPQAYEVLREFGLGQAGEAEVRMRALFALAEAGQISEQEPVRFWQDGEWQDIRLRSYEISAEHQYDYDPPVVALLNEALEAYQEQQYEQAEQLYQRVLALEPCAKEAYNNLASIYGRLGHDEQAQAMCRKAIELDPLYVLPRCNLALYMLHDGQVDEAQEMIAPLTEVQKLHVQELGFLSYVRARIDVELGQFEQARNTLEMALEVYPDYEPVQDLLANLDEKERLFRNWEKWQERWQKSNLARRDRQRSRLSTPDPTLAEALGIYTKELLTGMARLVLPRGGWSAFRKAELHQHLVESLQDRHHFAGVYNSLTAEEQAAFDRVQKNGGTLPWEVFDQEFGNDLDESPYWNYHEPETIMGRLRAHGLLVEVRLQEQLLLSIPVELREHQRQDG